MCLMLTLRVAAEEEAPYLVQESTKVNARTLAG